MVKDFTDTSVDAGTGGHTFTITVTNNGPSDAASTHVTDTVDARLNVTAVSDSGAGQPCNASSGQSIDCTYAGIANGASKTITVTYSVASSVAPATVANTASATTNGSTFTGSDSVAITAHADLKVTKTASPSPATAGTDETFTIKVENLGPSNNAGYTLKDVLPAGTTFVSSSAGCSNSSGTVSCTSTGLAALANETFTIVVTSRPGSPTELRWSIPQPLQGTTRKIRTPRMTRVRPL